MNFHKLKIYIEFEVHHIFTDSNLISIKIMQKEQIDIIIYIFIQIISHKKQSTIKMIVFRINGQIGFELLYEKSYAFYFDFNHDKTKTLL